MQSTSFALFVIMLLFAGPSDNTIKDRDSINPIIGNRSYLEKYGEHPELFADEILRIKTHFEYVEGILIATPQGSLTAKQRKARKRIITLLHEYAQAGIFPKNYDYPGERKPCFIDKNGTICAVGYLVAETGNHELALSINSRYQYSEVLEMNSPELLKWIEESGLTLEEVALIQPKYGPPQDNSYISPGYGITSGVLGGANVAFSVLNLYQLSQAERSKEIQMLGLATGIASTAIGIVTINEYCWECRNESRKALSVANIAMGTTSICISAYSLLTNRKKKNSELTWNFYCYPDDFDQLSVGFHLTKQL